MARGEALAAAGVEMAAARLMEPSAAMDVACRRAHTGGQLRRRSSLYHDHRRGRPVRHQRIGRRDIGVAPAPLRTVSRHRDAVDRPERTVPRPLRARPCPWPADERGSVPHSLSHGAWRRRQDQPALCAARGPAHAAGSQPRRGRQGAGLSGSAAHPARVLRSCWARWINGSRSGRSISLRAGSERR